MIKASGSGRAKSIPAGLALGAGVSMGVTVLGSAVAAWMILGGVMPQEWVGYCAMVILLAGAVSGAAAAVNATKRLRGQVGLASGGLYFLCLLGMTALFFGGQYRGMGVTALMVFCGCALVIMLAPGGANRAGCRRRKKLHR